MTIRWQLNKSTVSSLKRNKLKTTTFLNVDRNAFNRYSNYIFIILFEQLIFRFVGSPVLSRLGTQALVPPSSNHSSEDSTSPSDRPVLARARALVDYTPSPYDKDVLKFKVSLAVIYSKFLRPHKIRIFNLTPTLIILYFL